MNKYLLWLLKPISMKPATFWIVRALGFQERVILVTSLWDMATSVDGGQEYASVN